MVEYSGRKVALAFPADSTRRAASHAADHAGHMLLVAEPALKRDLRQRQIARCQQSVRALHSRVQDILVRRKLHGPFELAVEAPGADTGGLGDSGKGQIVSQMLIDIFNCSIALLKRQLPNIVSA